MFICFNFNCFIIEMLFIRFYIFLVIFIRLELTHFNTGKYLGNYMYQNRETTSSAYKVYTKFLRYCLRGKIYKLTHDLFGSRDVRRDMLRGCPLSGILCITLIPHDIKHGCLLGTGAQ